MKHDHFNKKIKIETNENLYNCFQSFDLDQFKALIQARPYLKNKRIQPRDFSRLGVSKTVSLGKDILNKGLPLFDLALIKGNYYYAKLLLEKGARVNYHLTFAAISGHFDLYENLIKEYPNKFKKSSDTFPLIHVLAKHKQIELIIKYVQEQINNIGYDNFLKKPSLYQLGKNGKNFISLLFKEKVALPKIFILFSHIPIPIQLFLKALDSIKKVKPLGEKLYEYYRTPFSLAIKALNAKSLEDLNDMIDAEDTALLKSLLLLKFINQRNENLLQVCTKFNNPQSLTALLEKTGNVQSIRNLIIKSDYFDFYHRLFNDNPIFNLVLARFEICEGESYVFSHPGILKKYLKEPSNQYLYFDLKVLLKGLKEKKLKVGSSDVGLINFETNPDSTKIFKKHEMLNQKAMINLVLDLIHEKFPNIFREKQSKPLSKEDISLKKNSSLVLISKSQKDLESPKMISTIKPPSSGKKKIK